MDDSAFWREAAIRFLECDPRGKTNLAWTKFVDRTTFEWGGGDAESNDRFEQLATECGRKLDPKANNHPHVWLAALSMRAQSLAHRYGIDLASRERPESGWLQDAAEASAKLCQMQESAAYEAACFSLEDPAPTKKWAVCTDYDQGDERHPQFFDTQEDASTFYESEAVHLRARDEGPIFRKNLGWRAPIPIVDVATNGQPCGTFEEYYPPTAILPRMPGFSTNEAIDRVFEGRFPMVACYLNDGWKFLELVKDAYMRRGHVFDGRSYSSVSALVVHAIYDFDKSLRFLHANIACESIANFFTSWQFWKHVSSFCAEVGDSSTASAIAGDSWTAIEQAQNTKHRLLYQFHAYAYGLRSPVIGRVSAPPPVSRPTRGQWLRERLKERNWDHNYLPTIGGPDRKTTLSVLSGKRCHPETLDKILRALNKHPNFKKLLAKDIPDC